MQLSASQLQTQHKALVNALKRGEEVEITYHGRVLGTVRPKAGENNTKEQVTAMAAFFGMHKDLPLDTVEEELRTIRQGRRKSRNAV